MANPTVEKPETSNTGAPGSNSSPQRIKSKLSAQEFLDVTSDKDRSVLCASLASSAIYFLDQNRPVYLENFGILVPKIVSQQRIRFLADKVLIQTETFRSVSFEKCSELVAFHREKFAGIAESKDLCAKIAPQIATQAEREWDERSLRTLLKGFVRLIRQEAVDHGVSHRLPQLGDFLGLHNRQGSCHEDWYAGSDIFLTPTYKRTLFIEPSRMLDRPILTSAWELLEAAYGPPAKTIELDLVNELAELGYDPKVIAEELQKSGRKITVAVFVRLEAPQSLIYCTEGLRRLGCNAQKDRGGNELVFQLGLAHNDGQSVIPDWPLRPLTIGWILMQSAKSKTVRPGKGMACGAPLIGNSDCELQSIFTTQFAVVKAEQLSTDGPFTYVNIIGITADEAQVAAKSSPEYLAKILEYKELDQCTKPGRSSVVARSYIDTNYLERPFKANVVQPEEIDPNTVVS